MINEQQVRALLGELNDPFLHRTLEETNGISDSIHKRRKKSCQCKTSDCQNKFGRANATTK